MTLGALVHLLCNDPAARASFENRPYEFMRTHGITEEMDKIVLFTMDRELIADYILNTENRDQRDEIMRFDMGGPAKVLWSDPSPHLDVAQVSKSGDTVTVEVTGEGLLVSCEISLESDDLVHPKKKETSGYPRTRFRTKNNQPHDDNTPFRSMTVKGEFANLPPEIGLQDLKTKYAVVVRNAWWCPGHASELGDGDKHPKRADLGWWTKGLRGRIT